MNNPRFLFRIHAVQRMFERNVSTRDVKKAFLSGQIIEDYSDEMAEPSRLLLAFNGRGPLHVVTTENQKTNEITIITVYIPGSGKWNKDFRTRRS